MNITYNFCMTPDELEFRKIIALRLRVERTKKRLSQEALAEMVNVSTKHYTKIENSHTTPSSYLIYKLAQALEISMDKLVKEVD